VPLLGLFSHALGPDNLVPTSLSQPTHVAASGWLPVHRRAVEVSDSGPRMVPNRRAHRADRRHQSGIDRTTPEGPGRELGLRALVSVDDGGTLWATLVDCQAEALVTSAMRVVALLDQATKSVKQQGTRGT
jgi:hypothetical protein